MINEELQKMPRQVSLNQALDELVAHVTKYHLVKAGSQDKFEELVANLIIAAATNPAPRASSFKDPL